MMRKADSEAIHGFSLLEMLVSVAVLLVIMAAVFSLLGRYQTTFRGQQLRTDMREDLRAATLILNQEIGQAGFLGFTPSQLSTSITGSASAQTVSIASTPSTPYVFIGEKLLVDAGNSEELVTVTGIGSGTVTGVFQNNHSAGAPLNALGAFPTGVLSTTNGATLQIYGDINADGTLQFVQYVCDSTSQALTRSATPITASSKNPASGVVGSLVPNPGATPCFQFTTQNLSGINYVTAVTVTLTAQSVAPDPATRSYATMTVSFNVAPRNVLAALSLAQGSVLQRLQPTPAGLPLP